MTYLCGWMLLLCGSKITNTVAHLCRHSNNISECPCSGVDRKTMMHIPNEDDTVGFDVFPPLHIALINIHLCVREWREQTACTASYTPLAIDLAIS